MGIPGSGKTTIVEKVKSISNEENKYLTRADMILWLRRKTFWHKVYYLVKNTNRILALLLHLYGFISKNNRQNLHWLLKAVWFEVCLTEYHNQNIDRILLLDQGSMQRLMSCIAFGEVEHDYTFKFFAMKFSNYISDRKIYIYVNTSATVCYDRVKSRKKDSSVSRADGITHIADFLLITDIYNKCFNDVVASIKEAGKQHLEVNGNADLETISEGIINALKST